MYSGLLRERFPDLNPVLDDLFLLEAHQIAVLPDRAPRPELAAVLHAHPRVLRFLITRHPPTEDYLRQLLIDHDPAGHDDVAAAEDELLWEIADLIVYQRDPAAYDTSDSHESMLAAIADVVDLTDKVVIDAGAGTGRVAFAVCSDARHVFAVEPVARLREHMRDRSARSAINNLFVTDGFLHAIPLPDGSGDLLITCRAIGWRLQEELAEIERVVGPGGFAVHLTGMPPPAEPEDRFHQTLMEHGYQEGTYREDSALKRKYWKQIGNRG